MPDYIPIITPPTPVGEPLAGSTAMSVRVTLPEQSSSGEYLTVRSALLAPASGAFDDNNPSPPPPPNPPPTPPVSWSAQPALFAGHRVSTTASCTVAHDTEVVMLMALAESNRPGLATVMLETSNSANYAVQPRLTLPYFVLRNNATDWTIPLCVHFNAPLTAATDLKVELRVVALSSVLALVKEDTPGQPIYYREQTIAVGAAASTVTADLTLPSDELVVPQGVDGIAALLVATLMGEDQQSQPVRLRACSAATTLLNTW